MEKSLQEAKHVATAISSEGVVIDGPGFGKIQFDDGAITYYRKSKRWIKFQSYLKGTLFTPTARAIDANTITYQGGKFVQVKYEFYGDDYKEYITLRDLPQSQRINLEDISFYITSSEGTHVSQQANGDLWLMRTATPEGITERCLMVIPAPTAVDANSVVYPIAWSYNEITHYLTITGDLTGATYPVVIDPSVELDTSVDTNATEGSGRHICRDSEGRIWTAHIDDYDVEINYSDNNGATFTTEEPWTSKVVTYGLAIAVDSARNVHIVWEYDDGASTYTLAYAKRTHTSSSWSSATSLNTTFLCKHIDILVDSNDYLNVCWVEWVNTTSATFNIRRYTTSWQTIVESSGQGNYDLTNAAFSLDGDGHAHVVYVDVSTSPDSLKHVEYTTSWGTPEEVDTPTTYDDTKPTLATDSDGNLHVSYIKNNVIYYRKKTGDIWGSEEQVTSNGASTPTQHSITLTSANNPIIVFREANSWWTKNATKTGSGWAENYNYQGSQAHLISAAWSYFPRCSSSKTSNVSIDGTIDVHIEVINAKYYVYFVQSNNFQPANTCQTVYGCQLMGDVNINVKIDPNYRQNRTICRDSGGRIWILYTLASSTLYAKYSDDGGRTWTRETVATDLSTASDELGFSICTDSKRNVHVVFKTVSGWMKYRKRLHVESMWLATENPTANSGQNNPQIAVDSNDEPHFIYQGGDVRYCARVGGYWSIQSEQVRWTGEGSSSYYDGAIAIDSDNHVHCVFIRNSGGTYTVRHKQRTTSEFFNGTETEIFSDATYALSRPSIAIDSSGNVYVAFHRDTSPHTIEVYKYTSSWASLSWGEGSNDMQSIAVDQDDNLYLTYVESYDYYVAKYTTSWQTPVKIIDAPSQLDNVQNSLVWAYSSDKRSIPAKGAMAVFVYETVSDYCDIYVWKSSDLTWTGSIQKTLKYSIRTAYTWEIERADGAGSFNLIDSIDHSSSGYQDDDTFTGGVTYHYRIRDKLVQDGLTSYGQHSNEYDVVYSGGGVTIQKSLVYRILTVPAATVKTLVYKINRVGSITKDVAYKIKRSIGITKDLRYVIVRTVPSVTKSLAYYVKSTKTAITKNVQYVVSKATVIQKNVQYAIKSTKTPTKSLVYTVRSTHVAITKQLTYYISRTIPVVTKSLVYNIKLNVSAITKSVLYSIRAPKLITKDLTYVISTAQTKQITKDLKYTIKITVPAITKNLTYNILRQYPITKSLLYTIRAAKLVTKDLKYTIKSSLTVTKNVQYYVSKSIGIQKNLLYAIKSSKPVTKNVLYYIVKSLPITKQVNYKIKTTIGLTKSLRYSILNVLAKSLTYTIKRSCTVTKNTQYFIRTTLTLQKSIVYTIVHPIPVTKQLTYAIRSSVTPITKPLVYAIRSTKASITKTLTYTIRGTVPAITKSLTYKISKSTGIAKQLTYTIVHSIPVTKQLTYSIQTSKLITKNVLYTIQASASLVKQLTYTIVRSGTVQKNVQYAIIPSAPILVQEGSCIRVSWVVT